MGVHAFPKVISLKVNEIAWLKFELANFKHFNHYFMGTLLQPIWEKENSEFKPAVLCLKTDLVSHTAHGGGIG